MRYGVFWFLVGLGSQLQIVASLSITELCVYAAAPFLYLIERPHMRRTGVLRFFHLSLLVVLGCAIACWQNHTVFEAALRGFAVTCLIPCTIVGGHYLFRKDMGGFKWMLLGVMLSMFICTFYFHKSVEMAKAAGGYSGEVGAEEIMLGPIYWITRLGEVLNLPARGWYLQCPIVYSFCAPLFIAAFSLLTSASGRSAALGALGAATLVLLGGKRPQGIKRRICDRFWLLVVIGVVGIFSAAAIYRIAATSGWLGEKSRQKYENQTQGDSSIGRLLLGGRMESFCGLIACIDKPIVGFGPWAMDEGGYRKLFLAKYGTTDDYDRYVDRMSWLASQGARYNMFMIPCHAYITEFWLWYGIFGLIFWVYVVFVLIRYIKQDCWAVPQYFMWLACGIPGYLWCVFFSPFADRVPVILFVVACLMVRAVRLGRQPLPLKMIQEIQKM